jgi:hypothetical protein
MLARPMHVEWFGEGGRSEDAWRLNELFPLSAEHRHLLGSAICRLPKLKTRGVRNRLRKPLAGLYKA